MSVDAAVADAVHYVTVPVAPGDDIVLMTDGFAALIETYEAYDKAIDYAKFACANGL